MPATRRRHPVLRLLAIAVPLLAIVAGAAVLGGNTQGWQWIEGLVRGSSPPRIAPSATRAVISAPAPLSDTAVASITRM